ncbi:MAG: APC family permease [Anaeromyxobacteraceae bacterium]
MTLRQLREAVLGSDRDAGDPRVLESITVGVVMAWIAMGGDLLGSCVYGPDVLTRTSGGNRSVLVVAGLATVVTLGVLAYAYTRMVAHFPHGGGGYTAAKHVVSEKLALVSGVALVFDAGFNVAVSVVACVEAAAAMLPPAWSAARLPLALGLVAVLAFLNLRGVKESVAVLVPIVIAFVGSHALVLGLAIAERAGALPEVIGRVPADLGALAGEQGSWGALGTVLRAYALGGAIYTGLESVSNGVPLLREPKVRSARRTMALVAGIPALIITVILAAFVLYGVAPEGDRPMNAILLQHVSAILPEGPWRTLAVSVPLAAEAALLLMAAQTGFVDGPRILGALATDRFLPKRLTRLNGRLAPAPGILVVAAIALAAVGVTGGRLEPLIAVFVVSVFVTFSFSQWTMLKHALRRRHLGTPWRPDATTHAVGLALCLRDPRRERRDLARRLGGRAQPRGRDDRARARDPAPLPGPRPGGAAGRRRGHPAGPPAGAAGPGGGAGPAHRAGRPGGDPRPRRSRRLRSLRARVARPARERPGGHRAHEHRAPRRGSRAGRGAAARDRAGPAAPPRGGRGRRAPGGAAGRDRAPARGRRRRDRRAHRGGSPPRPVRGEPRARLPLGAGGLGGGPAPARRPGGAAAGAAARGRDLDGGGLRAARESRRRAPERDRPPWRGWPGRAGNRRGMEGTTGTGGWPGPSRRAGARRPAHRPGAGPRRWSSR